MSEKITIQDFLTIVRAQVPDALHLRRGQTMMGLLSRLGYTEIYMTIMNHENKNSLDPFYQDSNIPAFLAFLADYVELE